jgi:parallel beta-helix repeat protein
LDSLKKFFVGLLIIGIFSSVLFSKRGFVFAGPPLSGDWIVTGTESYYDDVIVLSGNLIVENGGNLTFRKVTLKMDCTYDGQYNITVKHGGRLYVLDGSVITSVVPERACYLFSVGAGSTFRMNNSELHGCGWFDPMSSPKGLNIGSDDAIVENNLFSHNAQGINIWGNGIIVRNNNITMNDHIGIGLWAGGAHAQTIISNNHISLNPAGGIHAEASSPTIVNNTITSNFGDGIFLWNEANPKIQDNIITLSGQVGIFGRGNCSPIIQGNNLTSNNGLAGIILTNHCMGIIQGNILMNNCYGIQSHNYSNPLIRGNIITSNSDDGICCVNNSLPNVHWNDIYGNKGFGVINDDSSVTVNATYNYWGDGPSASSHVIYNPWLTESIFFAEITSPLIGETVASTVTVSTEVHARSGVHKVAFYLDDQLKYTDYEAPYEWNWDTTQYTETEHKITARAYDLLGLKISASITVFVDNTPPTVSIKEPTPENIYYGTISVSVNATDNQELGNVHFRVDNTEWLIMTYDLKDSLWKYDLNTTTLSDGQHTLMVLALDKAINPATTSTTLFTDNTPPTLTIQTPQSGTTVGLTLVVGVQASDASGIPRIEFYLQDVLVHTVADTPYQWSWDTTQYPNGEYTITVKAYDTAGHTQTSETTVTVKNMELPWWQTHFWTITQVLVATGGLVLALLTYLSKRKEKIHGREKRRKKKTDS